MSFEGEVVEFLEGLLGTLAFLEGDESEASALAGGRVLGNFDSLNVSALGEFFLEGIFLHFRGESADVNGGEGLLPPSLRIGGGF